MRFKISILLNILYFSNCTVAQTDHVFRSGFGLISKFNDTGRVWSADFPSGNNTSCNSNISSPQDCDTGRDVIYNDPADGHAGFSFTKLDNNGNPLADQSVDFVTTPWSCVKDNVTGLIWEVKTNDKGIHNKDNAYQWGGETALGLGHETAEGIYYDPSWNELVQGSNTQSLCGANDWRLPTVDELSGLTNHGTSSPAIDASYFPNTIASSFWTSSPINNIEIGAWTLDLSYGVASNDLRVNTNQVRLVSSNGLEKTLKDLPKSVVAIQGGEDLCKDYITNEWPDSRYIFSVFMGDRVVIDLESALMWKQCSEGLEGFACDTGVLTASTWDEALDLAKTENFAGFTNWRVPNQKELRSLVARNCYLPAINKIIFPNTPIERFWSSTPFVFFESSTWTVNMLDGTEGGIGRTTNTRVRLVRSLD